MLNQPKSLPLRTVGEWTVTTDRPYANPFADTPTSRDP